MNKQDVSNYITDFQKFKKPPSKWTVDEIIENLSKFQLEFLKKKFSKLFFFF